LLYDGDDGNPVDAGSPIDTGNPTDAGNSIAAGGGNGAAPPTQDGGSGPDACS
jgi:hypothetical protein